MEAAPGDAVDDAGTRSASRRARSTRARSPSALYGSVNVPIYQTSTYAQDAVGQPKRWDYGRGGNPTREAFQIALAALEGGAQGFAFASGMAAETTLLLTLRPGDHVVLADDVYGGTYRLLAKVLSGWGLASSTVDLADDAALRAAIRPEHEARVGRDALEPAAEDRGPRRGGRDRARGGRARRGRQHVRDAGAAAAARARRRRRRAQRHEVPRRALRSDRGRDRHERPGVDRAARVPHERGRGGAGPDGLLPRAPRPEDARRADARALRERARGRRVPRRASEGHGASTIRGSRRIRVTRSRRARCRTSAAWCRSRWGPTPRRARW